MNQGVEGSPVPAELAEELRTFFRTSSIATVASVDAGLEAAIWRIEVFTAHPACRDRLANCLDEARAALDSVQVFMNIADTAVKGAKAFPFARATKMTY